MIATPIAFLAGETELRREKPELVKAVIFDLDGTLLDTLTDIADSMNAALSRHGFPLHDSDDYRLMVGGGIDVLARRAVPRKDATKIRSRRSLPP